MSGSKCVLLVSVCFPHVWYCVLNNLHVFVRCLQFPTSCCLCVCRVYVCVCVVAGDVFVLREKEIEEVCRVFYYKVNCQIGRNCPVNQNQAWHTCVFRWAEWKSFSPAAKSRSRPWCPPNLVTNLGTQTDSSLTITVDEPTTDDVGKHICRSIRGYFVSVTKCHRKCHSNI